MNVPTAGQTRVAIVGATGMVGGYALRHALEHPAVGHATAIGRRKVGISHQKLKEFLHRDFADCSALAEPLSRQDAAVFCLGAYTGSVPDAELRKITVDSPETSLRPWWSAPKVLGLPRTGRKGSQRHSVTLQMTSRKGWVMSFRRGSIARARTAS